MGKAIGGYGADIAFAGLAPTLIGLYQLNVVIPDGVLPGSADVEIDTVDAATAMATISIGQ